MKLNRKNLFLAASAAITVAFTAQSAHAQSLFWDGNDSAANFGSASGTWAAPTTGTATAGWSSSSAGTAVVLANSVTTTTSNTANFGTDSIGIGGGTITVSGTVEAQILRFGSQTVSAVTLSGGTINLAAVASIHSGAGNVNHNITSTITGGACQKNQSPSVSVDFFDLESFYVHR